MNLEHLSDQIFELGFPKGINDNADSNICLACKYSRMTCCNYIAREIIVPANSPLPGRYGYSESYDVNGDLVTSVDGKYVDGVSAGLILTEDQIPLPIVCDWFEVKTEN